MNNNRSSSRRRGRGSSRPQGGGQLNRIDSRARGNASQLLEKYKKLAHDAALNGDRVQAEYYLQFADHYFRVIADSRAQKDDQRPRRDGDREQASDGGGSDDEGGSGGERKVGQARGRQYDREEQPQSGRGEGEGDSGDSKPPEEPKPRTRTIKPRRTREERAKDDGNGEAKGLDPSALPPAIGKDNDADEGAKPRRSRRPRPPESDGDETLETLG